jgi:hypothetical protein
VWLFNRRPDRWKDLQKSDLPAVTSMSDRSSEEIKRALVQKMVEWKLVPIENVPPELLAPIDGTIDDD